MWQLLKLIQHFFRQHSDTSHFLLYNHDLESFFTSITDDRFQSITNNPGHSPWFSVNVAETQQHLRLFRGRRRRTHVPNDFVPALFHDPRLPLRSTTMFAHVQPLLVVAAVEESWHHTYAEMLHNHQHLWFSCRYVDNRLICLQHHVPLLPLSASTSAPASTLTPSHSQTNQDATSSASASTWRIYASNTSLLRHCIRLPRLP